MPITKSAKKALRQSKRRRLQNLKRKVEIKKQLKDFKKALAAKNPEKAKAFLPLLQKALDKAAKTNVIKKTTASRKKSRLAAMLNKVTKI